MKSIINIRDLNVNYDNVCALSNINLTVNENDFLAIMGPNGGGKSTLLKSMLGLVKPTNGTIKILNSSPRNISGLLGYVPQSSQFDRRFPINVQDVILTGTLAKEKKFFYRYNKDDFEIIKNIMNKLDIYHLKDRQIGQLSGGQLQKVLIGRAIATNPKILLLDEPTASLDGKARTEIFSILSELNKNMTIILVTHDLEVISSHVNTIACINKKLFYHGKPELTNNIVQQIYGCPIDLIAHGVPHRVLKKHDYEEDKNA